MVKETKIDKELIEKLKKAKIKSIKSNEIIKKDV